MIDLGSALRAARSSHPSAVPEIVVGAAAMLNASDVIVYLVDFGQTVLEALADRATHADIPTQEPIVATMAGRAFTERTVITADRADGVRVWVPILEGSDATGVLSLTLPAANEDALRGCEELALLAGYLIASQARTTDVYNLYRRRRSMSLAASMQWDLLPPLVLKAPGVAVAGLLEPAYEVGGDCFDYALNGSTLDFAIVDAMGHGVGSSIISALALGSYRHGRRENRTLPSLHDYLAVTISHHLPEVSYATGVLARLDLGSGLLSWTNAGHPLPMLVRGGKVIHELSTTSTHPWGIGENPHRNALVPGTEQLEPGDLVLLHTDGVTDARTLDGEPLGIERLTDLVSHFASESLSPELIVRHLIASVRDHQPRDLDDDATLVLVRWDGLGSV